MKREIIIILVLALCLTGCGTDTTVYIPEEDAKLGDGIVVYIPVDPEQTAETEAESTEAPALTQPVETEPEQNNSATISKKTSTSSNKGSSGNQSNTSNKGTITGSSSQKPAATEPAATEPGSQTTITIPAATEPAATEPSVTEPPVTEPPETEPPTTEPPATEPPATEPPETESPATEPPMYDIFGYTLGALEYAMLEQINAHREDAGLSALALDERLCAIASCRSYEVSLVWSHTRPDGRHFATVLDDYGYGTGSAEELLVYVSGFADGTAMADRWMQSDSHRQLLLGSWSNAGIGVYDANGFVYVTCLLIG